MKDKKKRANRLGVVLWVWGVVEGVVLWVWGVVEGV